jgi:hypothetical protein
MELRIDNGQPCIATFSGKKETLTPTGNVVAEAQQRINAAQVKLDNLAQLEAQQQARLDATVLQGRPTDDIKKVIRQLTTQQGEQVQVINDAKSDIGNVNHLIDQRRATQINLDDSAVVAALLAPFNQFLEQSI